MENTEEAPERAPIHAYVLGWMLLLTHLMFMLTINVFMPILLTYGCYRSISKGYYLLPALLWVCLGPFYLYAIVRTMRGRK